MGYYIDHSSRCKLDFYVIAHTKEKSCKQIDTFLKICNAIKVKRVQNPIENIWHKYESRGQLDIYCFAHVQTLCLENTSLL